jgi:hypothetical protein
MKLDHNKFINLCKSQSSATVSDLEVPEVPGVSVIQFGQQGDDDNRKVGRITSRPSCPIERFRAADRLA